jgi:hypothetical protein
MLDKHGSNTNSECPTGLVIEAHFRLKDKAHKWNSHEIAPGLERAVTELKEAIEAQLPRFVGQVEQLNISQVKGEDFIRVFIATETSKKSSGAINLDQLRKIVATAAAPIEDKYFSSFEFLLRETTYPEQVLMQTVSRSVERKDREACACGKNHETGKGFDADDLMKFIEAKLASLDSSAKGKN